MSSLVVAKTFAKKLTTPLPFQTRRARAEELRCEADNMDDASDALREAHARRVRRVMECLEDASCRKRREADDLERRAMALREELNGGA